MNTANSQKASRLSIPSGLLAFFILLCEAECICGPAGSEFLRYWLPAALGCTTPTIGPIASGSSSRLSSGA